MGEYASNSHKSKEKRSEQVPEKKVEKIVSGSVKAKKKSGLQKITNVFVPEDVDNVKSYILEDIVVPAVKDIILDAVRAFLGVNGKSGGRSKRVSSMRRKLKKLSIKVATAEVPYENIENMFRSWMGAHYKLLSRTQRQNLILLFEELFNKKISIINKKMIFADVA